MTSLITRQPHLVRKKNHLQDWFQKAFFWQNLARVILAKKLPQKSHKIKEKTGSGFFAVTQLQPPKNKKKHGLSHNKKDIHQTWTTRNKLHLLTSQLQSIESTPKVLGKTWRFPRWLSHLSNRIFIIPGFWRMIISMSWMPLVRRSSTSFFSNDFQKNVGNFLCHFVSSPHKRVHNIAIKGTAHLGTHQTDHDQRPGPFKRGDSTGSLILKMASRAGFLWSNKVPGCQPRCGQEKQNMYHVCSCCW